MEETISEGITRINSGGLGIGPRIRPLQVLFPVQMGPNGSLVVSPDLRERIEPSLGEALRRGVRRVAGMDALQIASRVRGIDLQTGTEVALSQGSVSGVHQGRKRIAARGVKNPRFKSPKESVGVYLKHEGIARREPTVIFRMLKTKLTH